MASKLTNDTEPEVDATAATSKASDADAKAVLDAAFNGDSLPSGFTFDPHGKTPVLKNKDA